MDMIWLKRCSSSSTQTVLDEEDLLTLILLRVPYRKLMSLKSVSKKWLSLITTPHFSRLLANVLPPFRASGLFIQRPPRIGNYPAKIYFVPLDDKNTPTPFNTLTFAHDPYNPEKIRILQSCNALLLCSTCLLKVYAYDGPTNTYVYNPSTNKLATLPKHPRSTGVGVYIIGLAVDPSNSLYYKVIAFVSSSRYDFIGIVGDFWIYSSKTGTWRVSVQSFIPAPGMYFHRGVYWNGCMHWLSGLINGSEPESSVSDCLYFNVDQERLGTFPRPPIAVRSTSRRSLYFGESEDHLHVIEVCPYATSLGVYEMKSDYSEWFVKYQIDLDPISKVFPEMTKHKSIFYDKNDYAVAVLALIRRENFQEDSFLVLEIPGKAIRYNLVDRSFKVIWDFSVDFGITKIDLWPLGRFQVRQYIESLPCVYAP